MVRAMPERPARRHGTKSITAGKKSSTLQSRPVDKSTRNLLDQTNQDTLTSKPPAGLYIISTPIGHAGDITLRALDMLRNVDLVACEDTRHTGNLLSRYGINTRRIAYHEHNGERVRPGILRKLKNGAAIALVSDAGTPLVSDPGFKLVSEAITNGISIIPVPGASAPLAALVSSGLPTDRFFFAGFIPSSSAARKKIFQELADIKASLIFLESPRRLANTLETMADVLGSREAVIARELTKIHETILRGPVAELASYYLRDAEAGVLPRGEIVIVVGPPPKSQSMHVGESNSKETDKLLQTALQNMGTKDAAKSVAELTGLNRRDLYSRALQLLGDAG